MMYPSIKEKEGIKETSYDIAKQRRAHATSR
jgi:hypothetical protein